MLGKGYMNASKMAYSQAHILVEEVDREMATIHHNLCLDSGHLGS